MKRNRNAVSVMPIQAIYGGMKMDTRVSNTNAQNVILKQMINQIFWNIWKPYIHFQETSKCPTCRKEFKNISLRYYHECQRSYCDQCEKSFIHSNGLRRHIEMKHNGNKKYPCPHCDYKAGQKTHLRRHFIFKHQKSDFFLSVPINPENSSSEVELQVQ